LYDRASNALKDDFAEVRLEALRLVCCLCQQHPHHSMFSPYGERRRLVDDGMLTTALRINTIANTRVVDQYHWLYRIYEDLWNGQ
jgi:hypothetical protein